MLQFRETNKFESRRIKSTIGRVSSSSPPWLDQQAAAGRQDPLAAGLFVTTDNSSPGAAAQTVEGVYTPPMPNPDEDARHRI